MMTHQGCSGSLTWSLAFLACLFFFSSPARAALTFNGGECTLIDSQTNGIRLDSCKNLTDQAVDDIHLTFSYPGLNNSVVDYGQSVACTLFGTGNCFGAAVAPGDSWEGIAGGKGAVANVTLWGVGDLTTVTDFNAGNVSVTGYWTKGGVAVVPEPETLLLTLAGLLVLASRRLMALKH